jgi:hypothetical protein
LISLLVSVIDFIDDELRGKVVEVWGEGVNWKLGG